MASYLNGMKKSSRDHPERSEGSHKGFNVQAQFVFAREILHFVQDDKGNDGVIHGVVLKWNKKK
jgi:hypothetical protein